MKSQVVAFVVTHDSDDYLRETLSSLSKQTHPVDEIVLIDTGESPSLVASEFSGIKLLRLPSESSLASALNVATREFSPGEDTWFWLLHDDSAPASDCLQRQLEFENSSALIGVVGPKQVSWTNPRIIVQQGLTITPWGKPISMVDGELDQSQHDDESDVLAVSTAGMLIRSDIWNQIGGANEHTPPLALDYDISIRAKLAGWRVVVAPQAKLRHLALSLAGERNRSWLGGSVKTALRKSSIALRMSFYPLWSALAFWILLPLITMARIGWRLFQKRPGRVLSEIAGGIWGFFTVFSRLRHRPRNSNFKQIRKSMQASWAHVRVSDRREIDSDESRELLKAFESGEQLDAPAKSQTFTESGGWFLALGLLAFSFAFFPTGEAAIGAQLLPLNSSWWQVFLKAGSSWQNLGGGVALPAEPFNWVLLLLASFTFWAPSASVGLFLFAAPALAFSSAWRFSRLFTSKAWVSAAFGLSYATWPSLVDARAQGNLSGAIAIVVLPWLVFALARAAGIGRFGTSRSMRQTWSWVGVSGLLFAIVGLSSPVLVIPILVLLAAVTVTRIRRTGYLFWIPLPFAAAFFPLAFNMIVGQAHPVGVLADPSLTTFGGARTFAQLIAPVAQASAFAWAYLAWFVLGLLAVLTRRWLAAAALGVFAIAILALAYWHSNTWFVDAVRSMGDSQLVSGSPQTLLSALSLAVLSMFAILAEESKRWVRVGVATLSMAILIPSMLAQTALTKPTYSFGSARVVPWLLEASSQSGSNLDLLVLTTGTKSITAEIIPTSGKYLEDANVAYRYALPKLESSQKLSQISDLVANLASGNGSDLTAALSNAHVGFVMLKNNHTEGELVSALNSQPNLDAAGRTAFGSLWRVTSAVSPNNPAAKSPWSITKAVQLAIFAGFALLAIPNSVSRRRKSESSEIFIDSDGDSK